MQCASAGGLHRIAYTEWGDPANPRVLLCVHGLTRSGRDFDRLAAEFAGTYRVVCPDVAGRGLSSWLANPNFYSVPQYVADMVTLIARLNVETVDWFGTSMGGLIGLALAGLPETPIRKMLLNDVGPHLEPVAVQRIGDYLGKPVRFETLQQGIDYAALLAQTFGPLTPEEWREINTPLLHEQDGAWLFRYDPRIAQPFAATTEEAAKLGEAALWHSLACVSRAGAGGARRAIGSALARDRREDGRDRARCIQRRNRGRRACAGVSVGRSDRPREAVLYRAGR